jgi:hypothetical protein
MVIAKQIQKNNESGCVSLGDIESSAVAGLMT